MRVLVTMSAHFRHCQGRLYSVNLTYEQIARRYLQVFDEVVIAARSSEVAEPPAGWHEMTGPGTTFVPLPDYLGPWQFFAARGEIVRLLREAIGRCQYFMLRVPCTIGVLAWRILRRRRLPFAVEVVGDPWLSLSPGSETSIVRPLARRLARSTLRRQCLEAVGASYVTERYLQQQYPTGTDAVTAVYSDADMTPEMYVESPQARRERIETIPSRLADAGEPVRLGFVGTFNNLYKAPDIHIRALGYLRQRGMNVVLHMVGSGRMLEPMRELAAELGMADHVVFLGQLSSGRPVTQFLDGVDLYLNASRQEGLPKALVEAMARACPAIGSRVAGMPEILPGDCLVPAEDVEALGGAVAGLLADTKRMSKGAVDNWKRARDFSQPVLRERSREFYAECLRRSQANDPVRLSA